MRRILNQIALLLYCLGAALLTETGTSFLAAFLTSVIYISYNYCGDRRSFHLASTAVFMILSLFFPDFLLFYPVILYNMLEYKDYVFLTLLTLLGLWHLIPDSLSLLLFVILGSCISVLLQYQASSYEKLNREFKKTRDDSTELNLLLKEKNQDILKRQDYEIYTATLKERNRIAREIHDNVGHMLSRSILMTGAMKTINKEDSLREPLEQLDETLNSAMTSVRQSVHDLHDDSINLREAVANLTDTFTFCAIHTDYDMGYEVPREIKYSFLTIVKEALNNIMKHSNATNVHLVLREHPGLYQLVIADNGAPGAKTASSGLGLANMKDRVNALGGTMQIQTEEGFRIFITIPKKEDLPYDHTHH